LCADYERKEWPGLEWRAIRDLIKKKQDTSIMLIRIDDNNSTGVFYVPGIFSIDGYIDASDRKPEDIVALIIKRLNTLSSIVDLQSIHPFSGQVERRALFQPFKDFARRRDIVFAVGGVGSGLTTFLDQFRKELEENHDHCFSSADFDSDVYNKIRESRTRKREAAINYSQSTDHDQFDLKCLFATLVYMTYHSLRQYFASGIDRVVPDIFAEDPVGFADHYFINSGAMFKGELEPIVDYFFSTVQNLAEATSTADCVIVFMPWSRLASFFAHHSDTDQKKLAIDLWAALGAFAANTSAAVPFDKYPKVCLIVAGSEVPYGHSAFRRALVAKSLWPIPPLSVGEISELLGMVSKELEDEEIAEALIDWSGGSPWYVKLVLSCAQYFSGGGGAGNTPLCGKVLIEAACSTAEKILAGGPEALTGDLEKFIRRHLEAVREVIGDGQATDTVIEEAWAGPQRRRERGLQTASPRVEAFVASGLTWLGGDPWDPASPQYVFRRYPTLILRKAGRLPLVVYRSVTGRSLELAGH